MTDGAHAGITAGRALGTILGGDPSPTKDEGMTPAQMRAYLESGTGEDAYSESARRLGQAALALCDAHPEIDWATVPVSDDLEFPDGVGDGTDWDQRWKNRIVKTEGFDTLWKRLDPEGYRRLMDEEGPTGFQFGWGTNAARYALGLPPTPNPALLTVG